MSRIGVKQQIARAIVPVTAAMNLRRGVSIDTPSYRFTTSALKPEFVVMALAIVSGEVFDASYVTSAVPDLEDAVTDFTPSTRLAASFTAPSQPAHVIPV